MSNTFGFAPQSVAVVLGTRPETVKLAGIIELLGDAAWVVHTGEDDRGVPASLFAALGLPDPDELLAVGGTSRGRRIGEATMRLDALFEARTPTAVVAEGDTDSVVAAALAATARGALFCHVEAGLRSHDRSMPEEHNRVVADHLADLCCAPTATNVENLAAEGIDGERVVRTGSTIIEAVLRLLPPPAARAELCLRYGVRRGEFVLATFDRPENVDDPAAWRTILEQLAALPVPVVLPLDPRSAARAAEHGLGDLLDRLLVVDPVGYRELLGLEAEAALVISDSGEVQEECSIVKRPLIVVRRSTERPEVIGTFARRVLPGPDIGEQAALVLADVDAVHAYLATLPSPYGDGAASGRALAALAARIAR